VAYLQQDYERFNKQEQEAAEELAEYQRHASKALERLQRIRKLKQNVKERGNEVFHCSIEALDVYNGVNQQSAEATSLSSPSAFKSFDLKAFNLNNPAILNLLGSNGSFLPASVHSPNAQ
jgi:hypothetical protein